MVTSLTKIIQRGTIKLNKMRTQPSLEGSIIQIWKPEPYDITPVQVSLFFPINLESAELMGKS